jgi:hypothetical protein
MRFIGKVILGAVAAGEAGETYAAKSISALGKAGAYAKNAAKERGYDMIIDHGELTE